MGQAALIVMTTNRFKVFSVLRRSSEDGGTLGGQTKMIACVVVVLI